MSWSGTGLTSEVDPFVGRGTLLADISVSTDEEEVLFFADALGSVLVELEVIIIAAGGEFTYFIWQTQGKVKQK